MDPRNPFPSTARGTPSLFSGALPSSRQRRYKQLPKSRQESQAAKATSLSRALPSPRPDRSSSAQLPSIASQRSGSLYSSSASRSRQRTKSQAESDSGNFSDQDEYSDSSNDVTLALELQSNGAFGSAFYSAMEESLSIQQDTMAGIELVETVLLHVQPTTVVVPNRASDELVTYLERRAHDVQGNSGANGAYVFHSTGSSEFNYQTAIEKLTKLKLNCCSHQSLVMDMAGDSTLDADVSGLGFGSRQGSLRLGSQINFSSRISSQIGCAGAIMSELQRRRVSEVLLGDPAASAAHAIRTITMFDLANSMFLNDDTLDALQILRSESHPDSQKGGPEKSSSGAKESLSVYGLFQRHARTPQGKAKLKQTFLRPSTDLGLVGERQRIIAMLIRPENSETFTTIIKQLRMIKNMKAIMSHIQRGVDKPSSLAPAKRGVWKSLQRFSKFTVELYETVRLLETGGAPLELVNRMQALVDPRQILQVGKMVSDTIDFDATETINDTVILSGVNGDLDQLTRTYNGFPSLLQETARHVVRDVPEWAAPYIQHCIYYHQLGFLTVVSANANGEPNYDGPEPGAGDDWERRFVHQGNFYFKNRRMRELDDYFGDIVAQIHGEQPFTWLYGELDSLTALAAVAQQYNLAAPEMTESNVIEIKHGRHLLQELVVPAFVPNDCFLRGGNGSGSAADSTSELSDSDGEETPSMLILTGPNHSGKSVYLKQVALIVYLAHVGSFVPAEWARIGTVDRILTRVSTRESAARPESAFAIDMRQAAFSINLATRRSLVLIDEFGKGTTPTDGAALAAALFTQFADLGENVRPKVLAATHFHEIFEQDLLAQSPAVDFAHMDIQVDYNTQYLEDQVTFLYTMVPGRSISSFGTNCALMNGIDDKIVARAEALSLLMAHGEDLSAACARLSEEETRQLRKAENIARELVRAEIPNHRAMSASDSILGRNLLLRILSSDSTSEPIISSKSEDL
ncbi:hypothetical protein PpBr36_05125 [Pyricularia pennisetigena]|uniref:hypothetical protein n=1 Tax=Pyricularia pennisetigena TaxID=1578925 RepID=UPI0011501420|nr:hypothetical protein PpBr36_05125 [Pyricularia pennisetigena]TLS27399.1 hypothetical protein PpBr36_05125 [Pyricularia pennisetigena]